MVKRIQRKRTKGWRMPANAIYVGRPTKWGNPFFLVKSKSGQKHMGQELYYLGGGAPYHTKTKLAASQMAVDYFFEYICRRVDLDLSELRGKDLACWCREDQPCHADILLKLANLERDYQYDENSHADSLSEEIELMVAALEFLQ